MCYSVMVEADLEKLGHDFLAEIDLDAFLRVYQARDEGQPNIRIPRALDANFTSPKNQIEDQIQELAKKYCDQQLMNHKEKIEEKNLLINELQKKLAKKETKTNRTKLATAQRVIKRSEEAIQKLQSALTPEDSQIFKYSYTPAIVIKNNKRLIQPFRYQIRPQGSLEEFPHTMNAFNARVDRLETRTNWKRIFTHQHAAIILKSFFEWVPEPKDFRDFKEQYPNNWWERFQDPKVKSQFKKWVEIEFKPQNNDKLWSPAIFDICRVSEHFSIQSFAILTHEPSEFIARWGHDRSPVIPEPSQLLQWLQTHEQQKDNYYQLLQQRYSGQWTAALV